jgi:hypothetical protein
MPSPLIKSMAAKANVSIDKAEQAWFDARKEVDGRITDRKDPRYWGQVNFIFQKKLGLKEERLTFKEYAELEVAYADTVDHAPELPNLSAPVYGTCPQCGGPGVSTERRMNGNSQCAAGHSFPNPNTARPEPEPQPEVVVDPMVTLSAELSCFVANLFGARDLAHAYHLHTNSFSQHKALEELYGLLTDHADKWAEVGQGITGFPFGFCEPDMGRGYSRVDALSFVRGFISDLANCHAPCFSGNAVLGNMMQDLQADVFRIKYKLEQLK